MNFKSRAWAGGLLTAAIAIAAVVVVNAQKNPQLDVYSSAHFAIEIDGQKTPGLFRSVDGLSVKTEVIEYQQGDNNDSIRKRAGATRYGNIRLTRVFTGDRSLYDWATKLQKPDPIKVGGRIIMFDRHGARVATWTFTNGFPAKWELSELDASKNEVVIETIEIAHEGLTRSDDDN